MYQAIENFQWSQDDLSNSFYCCRITTQPINEELFRLSLRKVTMAGFWRRNWSFISCAGMRINVEGGHKADFYKNFTELTKWEELMVTAVGAAYGEWFLFASHMNQCCSQHAPVHVNESQLTETNQHASVNLKILVWTSESNRKLIECCPTWTTMSCSGFRSQGRPQHPQSYNFNMIVGLHTFSIEIN